MVEMRKSRARTAANAMDSQGRGPQGGGAGRLAPAPVARAAIWRPRLGALIDAGARRTVTLICAGPGWGKTALAASWVQSRSGPVAWLTLDARHNKPHAFWSDLVTAIAAAGVVLRAPPASLSAAGDTLLQDMAYGLQEPAAPVVVVLDDLQEVHDRRVAEGLTGLLRDAPRWLRFVLITRTEPTLPLHRLRAAGELTEIRAPDLAFTESEAAELLARRDRGLPADEMATLLEGTQGWAVGLRLAVDALAEHGIAGVTGELEAIADYFYREVLAGQPAEIRRFLLRTCLPERVCGELADALTAGTHSQRILEGLHHANAFTTPLDPHRRWFAYHPLLRDMLRHQLELESPAAVPDLHLLTAQWYARNRAVLDALAHAVAARDWPFVGRLLVEHGLPLVVSADRMALVEVMRKIPPDQIAESAELALSSAVLLFVSGEYSTIAGEVARVRALLAARPVANPAAIEVPLHVLEATDFRIRGDMPALIAATTDVLSLLSTIRTDQVPSLPQYRAIALSNKGVGLLWAGRIDHANRYLWSASTAARTSGLELVEINALAHLALLAFLQGSLGDAEKHVAAVIALAQRHKLEPVTQSAAAYLALALTSLERGRVSEAEDALRQGQHAQGEQPESAMAVATSVVQVHLLLVRGEPAAAGTVLRQARREASPSLVAPFLDRWLLLTESHIDLARDEPRAVIARYSEGAVEEPHTPAEQVCLARAYLAVGEDTPAENLLAHVREAADSVSAVTAWLVTALAADRQGHDARSIDALAHAVRRADRDGIRRPFRGIDACRISALAARQRWLTDGNEPVFAGVPTGSDEVSQQFAGLPVLSEREIDVLRYLPTVLTAAEIAVGLSISVNTVKAHMRAIYRKLGVARRREAVMEARQRGLL